MSVFVGQSERDLCPRVEEYILPDNILEIKNYRIYSIERGCNIAHNDLVKFLSEQKVFFLGTVGLVLVHELINKRVFSLPQFYSLLSPRDGLSLSADIFFEKIRDTIKIDQFEAEVLFVEGYLRDPQNTFILSFY